MIEFEGCDLCGLVMDFSLVVVFGFLLFPDTPARRSWRRPDSVKRREESNLMLL